MRLVHCFFFLSVNEAPYRTSGVFLEKYLTFIFNYVCIVTLCRNVHLSADAHRVKKVVQDPLELELQEVLNHPTPVLCKSLQNSNLLIQQSVRPCRLQMQQMHLTAEAYVYPKVLLKSQ